MLKVPNKTTARVETARGTSEILSFGEKDLEATIIGICTSLLLLHNFRLRLHGAIYRPDSFALPLRYCVNLKAIRYESTSWNRIVADKSHRVIVRFIAPIFFY